MNKSLLIVLCSVALSIAVHAALPAQGDISYLDSSLVMTFGFPAVSVFYFIILFSLCAAAVRFVCKRTEASHLQIGFRLGLSYAFIYLFGMQEIMIASSPFTAYGTAYIQYQFFMGLGDAIPVFLLCIMIAKFTVKKSVKAGLTQSINKSEGVRAFLSISICFFIERIAAYELHMIQSNCDIYPIPCYIWTAAFGMVLGLIYTLLYPFLVSERSRIQGPIRFVIIIGFNWIIFNSFMGLVMKDVMSDVLFRSGLDVIVLFFASYFAGSKRSGLLSKSS
ncbi:MAG: hypothetical protein PHC91_08400 [Eubacteriales bacterium]|nr:hypothetical protein [Eubacteriales bacterium]